ncbi:MAG TPA: cytochrome P460 family protein [Candidatus Sulfotelmatobacter sp.]|nr:cytochrome P460 family protein [Candidatus Sulfotelmatobacter sp.]
MASRHISGRARSVHRRVAAVLRDRRLISVAHEEGKLDDLRAVLGNDIAVDAYREGKPEFPDGATIARLAWAYTPSEENNQVFGQPQSYVAGEPKEGVQVMVKDSKKYAATRGWGFGQKTGRRSGNQRVLRLSCAGQGT